MKHVPYWLVIRNEPPYRRCIECGELWPCALVRRERWRSRIVWSTIGAGIVLFWFAVWWLLRTIT